MTAFEKEISGGEKFMIAYNEIRPPFVIQLALEGEGDPDPDDLHDALERTSDANPGACLRLDEAGPQPRWVLGPRPTLTVFDAPDFDASGEGPAPFLRWHLDLGAGPSCELILVRGKARTYLVFRAAHAVMDGQGTLRWVKDVMRCLRGEDPVGHPSTLSLDALLREIETEARPLPLPDALHPFGKADLSSEGDFFWRRVHVDRPLEPAVSGRICVALADAARRRGEGPVRINLPTDLRHYAPKERSTGNLFNSLFVEVPPDAAPAQIGLDVVRKLYKHEGRQPLGVYGGDRIGSLAVHRVKVYRDLARLHDSGRYPFSATLSHLGRLESAAFSAAAFTARSALFVPLVGDSGCVISLNGFDDHVEATVGLSDRFTGGGQLEELAGLVHGAIAGE